ncbi:AAA family ATPase [Yangia mangrovi]|uniref:AAA family ATPase n=1 Tax=Alloyangia mangrovi TaxID=1779329 RepID=A0ABT2KKE3_9RHOB|nr:AAA family ATPase [Alloyangia mangrovi]MCT4370092.1 AAA family ATPase [Alloyangia mangrovi]
MIRSMLALARLVAALHGRGLLHRDLRPARLLISGDFEQARCLSLECATRHHGQIGLPASEIGASPDYAAPELTGRIEVTIDVPADLYALGATFAEMMCGRVLYPETGIAELTYAHVARDIPDFHSDRPDLPAMLARITRQLLQKDPDDRYASAFGLVRDLERCLAQFEKSGVIRPFEDLSTEVATRFRLSTRLYGRAPEQARLIDILRAGVLRGQRTTVSVAGPSGIGKTAFVAQCRWQLVRAGAQLVTGKFDRFKLDQPYVAFTQAAQALIRPLLGAEPEVRDRYRSALENQLGPSAGLLTELVPELAEVMGPQPPPEDIPPAEANRRFVGIVARFISVFATQDTPLVLFLDDVQWADHASLNLLEALAETSGLGHFMVILGYRSTDVDPSHPAHRVIEACHAGAALSETLVLGPMQSRDVAQMMADSLVRDPSELSSLAERLTHVSQGNAFFLREYVTKLARDGTLYFDPTAARWEVDDEAMAAAEIPGSVTGYMTARLRSLPPQTLDLLDTASCVGSRFDLDTLARVGKMTRPEAARWLDHAIDETIILALGPEHSVLAALGGTSEGTDPGLNAGYRFRHDQIRQVVHERLHDGARRARHLMIARLDLQAAGDDMLPRQAVQIFGHLEWIDPAQMTAEEVPRFFRIGLMAAEQAQLALAFDSARLYLETVEGMLAAQTAQARPEHWLRLHMARAKCAFALNDRDTMERSSQAVLAQSKDPYVIADIQSMRIRYLSMENEMDQAADLCISTAAALGVTLPRHPGLGRVLIEVLRTLVPQGRRDPRSFAALPEAEDPRVRAAVRLMSQSSTVAYFSEPNLLPLLCISGTRLSLKHGLNPHAPYSFAVLALVLCGALGMLDRGYKYGLLALEVGARYGGTAQSKTKFVFDTFVRHWKEPLGDVVTQLYDSWVQNQNAGDQEDATYCAGVMLYTDFLLGRSVDTPGRHPEVVDFLRRTNMPHVRDCFLAWAELLALLSQPEFPEELTGPEFDYPSQVREFLRAGNGVQVAISSIAAGVLDFLAGRFDRAEERLALAAKYESNIVAQVLVPGLAFLRALNAWRLAEADTSQARRMHRIARAQTRRLAYWHRHGNVNLGHPLALLRAESLAAEGEDAQALLCLTEAETHAGPNKPFYTALAARAQARLLNRAHHPDAASEAARRASAAADTWGCPALGDAIRSEAALPARQKDPDQPDTLAATDLRNFMDLLAAITAETDASMLLPRLAELALATGSANFCAIALHDPASPEGGGAPYIEGMTAPPGGALTELARLDRPPALLRAVLDVCLRTGAPVVSQNPASEDFAPAARDAAEPLPRSLCCVPIQQARSVLGALYLHSEVTRHAFSGSRMALVQALADQAAIALQNTRLLHHLQRALDAQTRQSEANRRFVPEHLMQTLGQAEITDVGLNQYAETEMTVVFADIRGFTAISHQVGPKQTIEMINRYLEHVQPGIAAHGGFVGNYMGDGLLALFPGGPDMALFGVTAMARGLNGYNASRGDLPALAIGAGVHLGQVTLGMIGDPDHIQVGVLGSPVNVTARLDGLNKEFGSRVLVSEETVARLAQPERFALRSLGEMRVRGLSSALKVHEFLETHDPAMIEALIRARPTFERAVAAMAGGGSRPGSGSLPAGERGRRGRSGCRSAGPAVPRRQRRGAGGAQASREGGAPRGGREAAVG